MIYIHKLVGKALSEGKQWYFYSRKTQNRTTENGYWMAIGIEEPVLTSANKLVGMKKFLLFYAAEGTKTNWVMEEFCLPDSASASASASPGRSSKTRGRRPKGVRGYMYIDIFFQFYDYI